MSGMVRRDAIKRQEGFGVYTATYSPRVILTDDELDAMCKASYAAGRGLWISRSEAAAIEEIIAARLAAVTQ